MRSFRHLRIWLTTFQSSIWRTWVNKQKKLENCVSGILPLPWTYHEILDGNLMGIHRPKHLSCYANAWGTYRYSCTTAAHLLTSSHEDLSGWLLTAFKPWVLLSMKVWGRAAAQACAPLSVCRTDVAAVGLKNTEPSVTDLGSWLSFSTRSFWAEEVVWRKRQGWCLQGCPPFSRKVCGVRSRIRSNGKENSPWILPKKALTMLSLNKQLANSFSMAGGGSSTDTL